MAAPIVFDVPTPLGFTVHVALRYWEHILIVKHPVMRGRERDVQRTLEDPEEVRQSKSDPSVYLFYRRERPGRWICAVAKRLNAGGFLVTTFPTVGIKEGERIWMR